MFISNKKIDTLMDGIGKLVVQYRAILTRLDECEKKIEEQGQVITLLSHVSEEPKEVRDKFLDRLIDADGNFNYQNYKRKYGKIVRKGEDD